MTVAPNNVELPIEHLATDDFSGHKVIETYFNAKRATLPRFEQMMANALDSVADPGNEGSVGFFTVTLTWDGPGDVDLITWEPDGSVANWEIPAGQSGYLDVDNVVGLGPEHYFASCESDPLSPGVYSVGINNYDLADGRAATVQVASSRQGEIFSIQQGVGPSRGDEGTVDPIPVVSVIVGREGENWTVDVEAP
jgi:hypothetical protein